MPAVDHTDMMSASSDLPQDLPACHVLLRALQAQCAQFQSQEHQQAERIAAQSAALSERDRKVAELEQTIVEQETTIDRLGADLALLKRALFGSRRERYVEDPRQGVLFEATQLDEDHRRTRAARAPIVSASQQGARPPGVSGLSAAHGGAPQVARGSDSRGVA